VLGMYVIMFVAILSSLLKVCMHVTHIRVLRIKIFTFFTYVYHCVKICYMFVNGHLF